MLYDAYGRPLPDVSPALPPAGVATIADMFDRDARDISGGITPEDLGRIMRLANSGDIADQARLAVELPEKNPEIFHAVSTRRSALTGCEYEVQPGDDTPAAKKAAEAFAAELENAGSGTAKLMTFAGLREHLSGALLPGFAAAEIVWKPGGGLAGFRALDPWHFSFRLGADEPRFLTRDQPMGIELQPAKFLLHYMLPHASDPARGGLVRPLGWLHCFYNLNFKDLLTYIERYGMPFLLAKVDEATWQTEKNKLVRMIRDFGSAGGGVVSKSTEFEMQTSANTSGFVYFRLLEFLGLSITKVVLGQSASSGDASGLSGGDAQSKVRQDLLAADGVKLDASIYDQLARPWTLFNYGPDVAVPLVKTMTEGSEDLLQQAQIIAALNQSGLQVDAKEASDKFGLTLTRVETPPSFGQPFAAFSPPIRESDSDRSVTTRPTVGQKKTASPVVELSDDELDAELERINRLEIGDFKVEILADQIEREMLTGYAAGAVAADQKLAKKRKGGTS